MAKKDWMVLESYLDDMQLQILYSTMQTSCLVTGCAGSGKSVLATIKAKRIQENTNSYKVIVYTKTLRKYMNAGKGTLNLNNDFFHYDNWKTMSNKSADYIIVDEIQDFSKEAIQEFISATNKYFFFFGDSAQSIFGSLTNALPVDKIPTLVSSKLKQFPLYYNYRLPIPVARLVQHIGVDLDEYNEGVYKSKENRTPKILKYENLQKQVEAISNIIKRDSLTDVGILLPYKKNIKLISDMLNTLEIPHETMTGIENTLDFTTSNAKLITYHSAKGLQFETVFIPNVWVPIYAHDKGGDFQKALYVAMTRTYKDLYIMYSGDLQYPLNQIPNDLYKTTEIDEIDDI